MPKLSDPSTPTLDARLAALDTTLRYIHQLDAKYLHAIEIIVKMGLDNLTAAESDAIHTAATGRPHRGRARLVAVKGGAS